MRILHLIPSLALGGAERQLSYLAPELAGMGHEVHVAFVHPGPNLHRLDASGVVLHQFRSGGNYDPRILLDALRIVREIDPDIVQTWLLQMDIVGGLAAAAARKPWILTERSSAAGHPPGIKNLARLWMGGRARAVVSNSRGGDAYWESRLAPGNRFVVPNGLPLDEIEEAPPDPLSEFGIDPAEKVVLFVGRLLGGKNIPNLIAALSAVMAEERVVALFCGDGPLRRSSERTVGQLGLSGRFFFTGNTHKVWPLMKRADLFAFVSEFEGFPNVVIEAMACGCPLVVSDIPAHREFLDESMALLVDPRRPGEIAAALRRSLADPEGSRRRARAARERAAGWSTASMAARYEKLYRDIGGNGKGQAGRAGRCAA